MIQAGIDVSITSTSSFTDSSQIKATRDLIISTNSGIVYNDLYAGRNLSITNNVAGNINHNYKSYSIGTTTITNVNGNITFGISSNTNSGSLYSKGNLLITATSGNITNNSNVFSDANIELNANNLSNLKRLMADK